MLEPVKPPVRTLKERQVSQGLPAQTILPLDFTGTNRKYLRADEKGETGLFGSVRPEARSKGLFLSNRRHEL